MCIKTEISKFITSIMVGILIAILILSVQMVIGVHDIKRDISDFTNLFTGLSDGSQITIEINE